MLNFVFILDKIACTRCIAISITYAEAENEDEGIENDQDAHLTITIIRMMIASIVNIEDKLLC